MLRDGRGDGLNRRIGRAVVRGDWPAGVDAPGKGGLTAKLAVVGLDLLRGADDRPRASARALAVADGHLVGHRQQHNASMLVGAMLLVQPKKVIVRQKFV